MDRREFLSYRLAFSGLPFGELQQVLLGAGCEHSWNECCRYSWKRLRGQARQAEHKGDLEWAAQAWGWAACAYQAASLGFNFVPETNNRNWVVRTRHLAHFCYLRALRSDPSLARPVRIPSDGLVITGYLRPANNRRSPAVVLFNGLDSLCEVEMHAFGNWLLSRGLSVLSLDLPAGLFSRPRYPQFAIEELAPAIADWIGGQPNLVPDRIGAFGVSFGGHLAARALSGDARFRAGVAVSPPAWIGVKELKQIRLRFMFALAFNLQSDEEVYAMADQIQIARMSPPRGKLLYCNMENDELFGAEHVAAFIAWANSRIELRKYSGEHVGTSCIHTWLPEACGWLRSELSAKEVAV